MDRLRAISLLSVFLLVTAMCVPLQWLFLKTGSRYARALPHRFHKFLCWLFDIRLIVSGKLNPGPVLIISNHISWLDIIVLSGVGPVHFVAKREVGDWPFFGMMARLQETIFVDRERRAAVRDVAHAIAERLKQGAHVVLFAEGTSSDGNRILPFKSALIGAAALAAEDDNDGAPIQTLTLAYTHLHGLPMARLKRSQIAWYGDMDILSHIWGVMRQGPLDVHIALSEPIALASLGDRKQLAAYSETQVRRDFATLMTARPATKQDAQNA